MRRCREELSKLFKRLYEDNVLGRVTDEQYRMLAGDYTGCLLYTSPDEGRFSPHRANSGAA